MDCAEDAEQDAAEDAAPRAILQSCLAFEAFCMLELALEHRASGQAVPLGLAPPTRSGQRKAPEGRVVFLEHNDLTPAGPGLQGGEGERRPR